MNQKDQPEALGEILYRLKQEAVTTVEGVYRDFQKVAKMNGAIHDIVIKSPDVLLDALDQITDVMEDILSEIDSITGKLQLTKLDYLEFRDEYAEPENQSPYCAGFVSHDDVMEG